MIHKAAGKRSHLIVESRSTALSVQHSPCGGGRAGFSCSSVAASPPGAQASQTIQPCQLPQDPMQSLVLSPAAHPALCHFLRQSTLQCLGCGWGMAPGCPLHPAGTGHSSLTISQVNIHHCRTNGLVKAATISSHECGTKLGEKLGPLPSLPSSIPKMSRLVPPLAIVANEPGWTLVIVSSVSIPGEALQPSALGIARALKFHFFSVGTLPELVALATQGRCRIPWHR